MNEFKPWEEAYESIASKARGGAGTAGGSGEGGDGDGGGYLAMTTRWARHDESWVGPGRYSPSATSPTRI